MFRKIKNNHISKAVIAGGVFMVAGLLQKGISVLTTPIFTRLMDTEEYGNYNVFISWMNIFSIFITLKIAAGVLQQTYVKNEKSKKTISSSIQSLSTLLSIIATCIYFVAAPFWNSITGLNTELMIAMFISIWANNVFEIWAQEKRVDYDYAPVAVVTVLTSFLKPVAGILSILAFPDMKVEARIYSMVVIELMVYTVLFLKQIFSGPLFSRKYWSYSLKFAIPLLPHYLSQQVLSQTDRLMIKNISGASDAGVYSLAYQISMLFTIFNTAMSNSLNPWIYKNIKNKTQYKIQPIVIRLMRMLSICIIAFILIAPEIVSFFAPEQYYGAVYAIPAIAISCLYMFMYSVFSCFEFYYEKKAFIAVTSILCAVVNIALNLIFIPIFGFIAASYTTLICYAIYAWAHYLVAQKICRSEYGKNVFNLKKLFLESIIPTIVGLAAIILYQYTYIRLMILVAMMIFCFLFRKTLLSFKNIYGIK